MGRWARKAWRCLSGRSKRRRIEVAVQNESPVHLVIPNLNSFLESLAASEGDLQNPIDLSPQQLEAVSNQLVSILHQSLGPEQEYVDDHAGPLNDSCPSDLSISFRDKLASWALSISRQKVTDLLKLLHTVQDVDELRNLPDDSRALLRTPRLVKLVTISGGSYYYFGLEKCLQSALTSFAIFPDVVYVTINVD